jgi:queuine/archaeosine tRNA-ribosyltransferase
VGDPLGLRLATLHNLRFYTQLLERITATGHVATT